MDKNKSNLCRCQNKLIHITKDILHYKNNKVLVINDVPIEICPSCNIETHGKLVSTKLDYIKIEFNESVDNGIVAEKTTIYWRESILKIK